MPSALVRAYASAFLIAVASPLPALAQSNDAVGVRAQGMAGAFTAVADDASATWWNPAGLAGGAYLNTIIEYGTEREPRTDRDASGKPVPAWQVGARGFAAAFPALGLSYYRLQVSEIQPQTSTAAAGGVRQDQGTADVRLRSLLLSQFGATVGQSIGEHIVVGSTLKLVRGSLVSEVRPGDGVSLDQAADLEGPVETHAGLDLGAMVSFGSTRLGLVARNVSEPVFGSGADALTLRRQVRAGLSYGTGRRGVIGSAVVAVDADLTTTPTVLGDERRLAAGAEAWVLRRNVGFRGGMGLSTIGARRSSLSGGVSLLLRSRTYVDGQATGGSDDSRRGWSVALRVTF
jgi:F plasmid transfer operon, TraF, protein